MFIKLLIISIILVAFVVLILGIRKLLNPGDKDSSHKYGTNNNQTDESTDCSDCELKDIVNCDRNNITNKNSSK